MAGAEMNLERIKVLISRRQYRLSSHAEFERDVDQITVREIEEALRSTNSEIIEDYPNDPRGPSCLILGFTKRNRAIHAVCGLGDPQILVVITVYRPDSQEWINARIRKERKT